MSVFFGVLGGVGVDFVACELCETTRYIRTIINKLLNVNLPPSRHKLPKHCRTSKNQPLKSLKILAFCSKKASIFTKLKYTI